MSCFRGETSLTGITGACLISYITARCLCFSLIKINLKGTQWMFFTEDIGSFAFYSLSNLFLPPNYYITGPTLVNTSWSHSFQCSLRKTAHICLLMYLVRINCPHITSLPVQAAPLDLFVFPMKLKYVQNVFAYINMHTNEDIYHYRNWSRNR